MDSISDTGNTTNLSLRPTRSGQSVLLDALRDSLNTAERARMAVAYWTVGPDFVSPKLPTVLSLPESFLCVDIHLPTSIDALDALAERGARVYLYLRQASEAKDIWMPRMPDHLLHTKLLCYDKPASEADIYIGSHNWTHRALTEINLEASLQVRTSCGSEIYGQVSDRLEEIRSLCEPFDRSKVDYYKWLQGTGEESVLETLELEGEDAGTLADSMIGIFGGAIADIQRLRRVGGSVIVWATDSVTNEEFFYESEVITASANDEDIASLWAALLGTQRRYAFRRGKRLLVLEKPASQSTRLPTGISYCVSLRIGACMPSGTQAFMESRQQRWKASPKGFPEGQSDPGEGTLFSQPSDTSEYFRKLRKKISALVKIRVPAVRRMPRAVSGASLEIRRQSDKHELLTKMRIVKPKPNDPKST